MQSLWMVAASFFFACMGVFVKFASDTYSIVEIVFYRSLISLVFTFTLTRVRNIPVQTRHWRFQLWRSIIGFVSMFFYFSAITMLPLATAVTLNYTSPLFLALFLSLFGKKPLQPKMFGALVLGFFGVALLLRPAFHAEQLLGEVAGLCSGMLAGLAFYNMKELGERGEVEERTVFYFSLVSFVGSAFWLMFSEFHPIDLTGGLTLLGMALFGTLAQLSMTRAYRTGNTLISASLGYSAVIFSSIFGIAIWGDSLSINAWFAIALIIASGVLSTWFSRRTNAKK